MSIMFAFITQSSFICAQNTQGTYVELHKMDTSQTGGGIFKPKKAPARRPVIPITAFLNESSHSLDLYSSSDTFIYCIYDENDAVVLEGIMDFSTFEEDAVYNQKDAEGFIKLNALRFIIAGKSGRKF